MSAESERSFVPLDEGDLDRLVRIARARLEKLFRERPYSAAFENCLVAVCLGQGGALHYLDGENGIKDLDVWCFFTAVPDKRIPPRWRGTCDFGNAKFGRHPDDPAEYTGRRVDVLGRDIPINGSDLVGSIRTWLQGRNRTPSELKKKAMIGLWPERIRTKQIWPAPR